MARKLKTSQGIIRVYIFMVSLGYSGRQGNTAHRRPSLLKKVSNNFTSFEPTDGVTYCRMKKIYERQIEVGV